MWKKENATTHADLENKIHLRCRFGYLNALIFNTDIFLIEYKLYDNLKSKVIAFLLKYFDYVHMCTCFHLEIYMIYLTIIANWCRRYIFICFSVLHKPLKLLSTYVYLFQRFLQKSTPFGKHTHGDSGNRFAY
jgi:hypothetical protein